MRVPFADRFASSLLLAVVFVAVVIGQTQAEAAIAFVQSSATSSTANGSSLARAFTTEI